MAAEVAKAVVAITADTRRLRRDLDQAEDRVHRMSRGMKVGLVAGAAAAVGGLYMLGRELGKTIKAAQEAETVQRRTEAQLKALGLSYGRYAEQIETVINRTSKLAALDDEELQGSFTNLVRATGNVNEALKLTALAADVARGKNISLESATMLVTKAQMGQAGALRRAGIDIDTNATKTEILAALQQKFAGQAESYGKTSSGAIERFHVAIENVREAIGMKLLPVFTPLISRFADWASKLAESKQFQEGVQRAAETMARILQDLGAWIVAHKEDFVSVFKFMVERVRTAREHIATLIAIVKDIVAAFNWVKERVAAAFLFIKETALRALANLVEPWSHLPGKAGQWARDIKDNVNRELNKIQREKEVRISAKIFASLSQGAQNAPDNRSVRVSGTGDGLARAADGLINRYIGDGIVPFLRANPSMLPAAASAAYAGMAANPGGLSPWILDELAIGQSMGLRLSSGLRPGATVAGTNRPSLHSVGQAIDMVGTHSQKSQFARAVYGRSGVAEVLYDPLGGPFLSPRRDHSDHVHVGVRSGDGQVGVGDGPGDVTSRQVGQTGNKGRTLERIRVQASEAETRAANRVTAIDRDSGLRIRALQRQLNAITVPTGDRPEQRAARQAAERERARISASMARERASAAREGAQVLRQAAATLFRLAAQAQSLGDRALANDLRSRALDLDDTARGRDADALDADQEAGAAETPPVEEPGAEGGDTRGEVAVERSMEDLIREEAMRMVSAHRENLMRIRHGFFGEFGPDIFSQGPGGLQLGSGALGSVKPPVTIVQNITKVDPDPFEVLKSAQFVAEAVM